MVLETERLLLREMTKDDFQPLCKMLQDPEVMYAYGHAFSDEEAHEWLNRQLCRYRDNGFGLWAVELKSTGEMIGQCGITLQSATGDDSDAKVHEVGYLFCKAHWGKGYATESAVACRNYAFKTLGVSHIYSIIRDTNNASRAVAERNGMTVVGTYTKFYHGTFMPHIVYCVENPRK